MKTCRLCGGCVPVQDFYNRWWCVWCNWRLRAPWQAELDALVTRRGWHGVSDMLDMGEL